MLQAIRKHLNLLSNKNLIVRFFFAALILIIAFSFTFKGEREFSGELNLLVTTNCRLIVQQLDSIKSIAQTNSSQSKIHYQKARQLFKEIEFYVEYNYAYHSKFFINGPLVNKAEREYGYKTFVPHGFQVLESVLYSEEIDSTINFKYEVDFLKNSFGYVEQKSRNKNLKPATIIDMLRFELVRIMSLYLNGYDCTINKNSLVEIQSIFDGFNKTISLLEVSKPLKLVATKKISSAKNYLKKNSDYNKFNRLEFISAHLIPLYENLYNFYDVESAATATFYGINIRRQKFYDAKWLNGSYFSVVLKDSFLVSQQAEIGKLLFFDPVLSGNNKRACASCHSPAFAFGGGNDFNAGFENTGKLKRNTPSLINALYQKNFFHDGRSMQLEDQISDVLGNHNEMFSEPEDMLFKLKNSAEYKKYFAKAFAGTEDTAITYYAVLKSIAEFERKLVLLDSKFDKYLRGDKKQLNANEVSGYNIFAGKGLCGSCHFFPLFNGLVPPFYSDSEFEVIGVPKDKTNKFLDGDSGRYFVSHNKIHLGAFKTPGIRNLKQTAPYMHNGVYTTVDEIIEFYQKGGGAGLGLNLTNQTLPFDSLSLDKTEVENLKLFLFTLEDDVKKIDIPKKLPAIQIKGLENRPVGGFY
jgi:cytochrome c peroxidase